MDITLHRIATLALLVTVSSHGTTSSEGDHREIHRTAPEPASTQTLDWRSDVSCTGPSTATDLQGYDPPAETELPGCAKAHCVAAHDTLRICLCALHSPDEGQLIVERSGQRIQEIDTEMFNWIGPGSRLFDVLTGDLDGDGKPELIVPHLETVSNGMGCDYWTITIFDGRDLASPPVDLPVTEYGRLGTFLRPPSGGPCRILSTNWKQDYEPGRGAGLYLTGSWYTYRKGNAVNDASRPVLRRRYLYSFEAQRWREGGNDWATSTTPFHWLLDPHTQERP
jgi:hypothetical protein